MIDQIPQSLLEHPFALYMYGHPPLEAKQRAGEYKQFNYKKNKAYKCAKYGCQSKVLLTVAEREGRHNYAIRLSFLGWKHAWSGSRRGFRYYCPDCYKKHLI